MTPISAPPTPVTPTHVISMERCRSSEAVLGSGPCGRLNESKERDGRKRDVKATSLLLRGLPSSEEIRSLEVTTPSEKLEEVDRVEEVQDDEMMDIDEPEISPAKEVDPDVWGMPKWGREEERKEVRKGVRLIGMEELPRLIEQHELLDIPSHVLFPWLHGISDSGRRGAEMGAFFGHAPPFQPPPYRGLCLLLAPPHPLDAQTSPITPEEKQSSGPQSMDKIRPGITIPRERSETMSTSSESYRSTTTTEATSPSIADSDADVQMHPCESKRVSVQAKAEGLDTPNHPLPCESAAPPEHSTSTTTSSSSSSSEDSRPNCILLNSLHISDVFELPQTLPQGGQAEAPPTPCFRPARLPPQINLRNLNIQQIKYATISDLVIYAKGGVGNGVLEIAEQVAVAQEELWKARMEEYYARHAKGQGEGLGEPVRYGVWVLVEPFRKLEKAYPHLVNIDSDCNPTTNTTLTDLFEREATESRAMTRGSEVLPGFWVGNDCDVPGGADDGAGSHVQFDLCVRASECLEMPNRQALTSCFRRLQRLDEQRAKAKAAESTDESSWAPSPATIALRNLLSSPKSSPVESSAPLTPNKRTSSPTPPEQRRRPAPSSTDPYDNVYIDLDVAGSCRSITGQLRNLELMSDRVIDTVYFLRRAVEGRDQTRKKRTILVHCQDGYTESSIIVLSYIMSTLAISLPEAFLYLQNQGKRSFFLYPSDKPLLRMVDAKLADWRKSRAETTPKQNPSTRSHSPTIPATPSGMTKWKSWGMGFGSGGSKGETAAPQATPKANVEVGRETGDGEMKEGAEASNAKIWFEDKRFDGFPSRILPFLYLGNLEHAGNAGMLEAIGITHVVSVGESLISCQPGSDPMYGMIGPNTLSTAYYEGRIKVLDLNDVRDDGNDPLRPLIARACAWIEDARMQGGTVLVHCRVGVSRSASIVIAYMMQQQRMGLMDAYLLTRARRLNVLIQPNLRFFHELFGWEVELARREAEENNGMRRRILYSWPSFCRDLHCLNRRFLCN